MQNGGSGRPTGARAFDQTEGQPCLSELENQPASTAQPGDRPNGPWLPAELATAIAEIKELYERENDGLTEPIDMAERDHDLPRQQADNLDPERDAEGREVNGAQARSARAIAALASEHEKRLVAEAELDRSRAEVEGERERTQEALQQAQAAGERAERAEAELKRFCREVEAWHRQTEQEFARLGEEANGLELRLQAAETEAAQVRQTETVRQSFRGLHRIPGTTSAVLAIAAAVVGGCVLYFWLETADSHMASVLMPVQRTWHGAKEIIFGGNADFEAEEKRPGITPVSTSAALIRKTEQPQAHTLATESVSGQNQTQSGGALDPSAGRDEGGGSQSKPEAPPDRQQPAIAALTRDRLPEGKSAEPGSISTDVLSHPKHNQPQALNVTDAVVAPLSIHYRQGSTSVRADAERLAKWLASSGFGASELLRTQQAVREPVVRYFFVEDAGTATRMVGELRKGGGKWRVEDCTHYRHKPPVGTIQVWPI